MNEQCFVEKNQTKYFIFGQPPNEFFPEHGQKLGPITVAYETYGQLNHKQNNAILICHALSGDAHVYSNYSDLPGWWENAVGPGKIFDTEKYFIICSNVLGGCKGTTGPSSINPNTLKPYALSFPLITIKDMVNVQKALIDHLNISKLYCIAGGSMGGMQVLQWLASFPDFIESAIVIASTSKHSALAIGLYSIG